ncbi:TIGR03009 domain-containing protein [Gemmata sp. JC717]|uniref:TIGR03009 domain-containing protein n=1 Tax=Gemmata algarum TaxID=2975278 RepID=UPI0021BAFEDD|nr:TIGR03009 domain-containing protein [Gemmata algarum]MDY3553822.1 TIGR03009 domain-containing protein [Gemmata algarum]
MRSVAILFAISLIAACPPRRGRVVYVPRCPQPAPVVISDPVSPPATQVEEPAKPKTAEKPAEPVAPLVAEHLKAWEEKTAALTNVRAEVGLTRTDSVSQKSTAYSGQVLCMKPNCAVLRLNNAADKTGTDYEAYICNETAVYYYNGIAKTVTEFKRPPADRAAVTVPDDNPVRRWLARLYGPAHLFQRPPLQFLTRVKARELQEQFDISVYKTEENYIYLDIKPRLGKDQHEFKHLRLALYGTGPATAKVAYLPAQVYVLKPNDDTEVWKFTNPQVDLPGVEPKHFQYVEIKEKGWTLQKANGSTSETEEPKP